MKSIYGQEIVEEIPKDFTKLKSRIMYVENKGNGEARISRIYFSRSGRSLYYKGKKLISLNGRGFKSNYMDVETGTHFWVSGPKRKGGNRLYGGDKGLIVDEDVAQEYYKELS